VQQVLSVIAKERLLFIPFAEAHLTKVLGLLVNPSVTELNCTAFDHNVTVSREVNNFLVKHALKNCPNITKIELRHEKPLVSRQNRDTLPVECFKASWNNLKSIKSHNDYICNDDTLKFIQENFPNIESVN
jgi:hypothetical protein